MNQSAYRHHHSTETAVCILHNDLVRAIDKGHVTALVLLDLSAAFDTVNHELLIEVLKKRFAIDGVALNWFKRISMTVNRRSCSAMLNLCCMQ